MQTREQLVLRALRELGVPGAGQMPSAEDAQVVDGEIAPIMADLSLRNVWSWGDPDRIDDAAAVHLAIIIANSVANQFGKDRDETKRLMAEVRLRELDNAEDAGDPIPANYF